MRCIFGKIYLLFSISLTLGLPYSQAHDGEKNLRMEVAMRMIGHQVLLNTGDSTSLVLPVEQQGDQYRISFDTEFQFHAGEIATTVNEVVRETGIGTRYILAVESCETGQIVYGYHMNDLDSPSILPCLERKPPYGCYNLLFTLLPPLTSPLPTPAIEGEEVAEKGLQVDQLYIPVLTLLGMLLVGGFFVFHKRLHSKKIPPHLIALGGYQFDRRNTELIWNKQRTSLTHKEADLLMLLFDSANEPIEREVLLQEVWGDEGNYVGRTLDVFISKLRKKLEADATVKIVNIRGVGYKLVLGE